MLFPITRAIHRDDLRSHQENIMYMVSVHPSRTRRLLASVLTVAIAFGALPQAQAQQQQAASTAANGADRSIIFVGGRKQHSNTGSSTHARTHPPGPCISTRARHSTAGDDCSLNPQPIPPGHQNDQATDKSLTHAPVHPRLHKPAANPHKGD